MSNDAVSHDRDAFLAIDGGATKTDAVIVDRTGAVIGRARSGPSNHQMVGVDVALDTLGEAIAAALDDAGIVDPPLPAVGLGVYCLAGIDLPIDEERLGPAISFAAGAESTSCTMTPPQ